MKIFIMYAFKDGPHGGVNQFLKALKTYFEHKGIYTDVLSDADIVLFNSSNATKEVLEAKKVYPGKLFVQRIDGPGRLYNDKHDYRDIIVNTMNLLLADATVFQSNFSREANYRMGLTHNRYETTIINAPNEDIFNCNGKTPFDRNRKIRLIASSWSSNWNKGFKTYQYLDKNLNFDKYEMFFVGNSPVPFQNIHVVEPLRSDKLADKLRDCDIYITASKKDPCSNALIEALFCGLPAVVLNDGGHPEIVGACGRTFSYDEEIPRLLDDIVENYDKCVSKKLLLGMEQTGDLYYNFIKTVYNDFQKGNYICKTINILKISWMRIILFYIKCADKLRRTFVRKA